ncbi:hypothetical protein STEG23_009835, partial [Scotinomys teguina]
MDPLELELLTGVKPLTSAGKQIFIYITLYFGFTAVFVILTVYDLTSYIFGYECLKCMAFSKSVLYAPKAEQCPAFHSENALYCESDDRSCRAAKVSSNLVKRESLEFVELGMWLNG